MHKVGEYYIRMSLLLTQSQNKFTKRIVFFNPLNQHNQHKYKYT